MLPNDYVELEGEDLELFKRLVTLLDDVDDVQNVYHNVRISMPSLAPGRGFS